MAQARAQRSDDEAEIVETPPVDTSDAIREAYRFHRTKRHIRVERRRRNQWAGVRFAVTLAVLAFVFVVLSLTVWAEVQRAFGL